MDLVINISVQRPWGLSLDPQGNIHVAAIVVQTPLKSSHLKVLMSDHMDI